MAATTADNAMTPTTVKTSVSVLAGAVGIGIAAAKKVRNTKMERGPMKMGLTIRRCSCMVLLFKKAASSNKHHNLSGTRGHMKKDPKRTASEPRTSYVTKLVNIQIYIYI